MVANRHPRDKFDSFVAAVRFLRSIEKLDPWIRRGFDYCGHAIGARVAIVAIAPLVLIANHGGPGLWEPQELAVADRAVARAERDKADAPKPEPAKTSCPKQAPTDTGARTLTERAAALDTTDRGMRWPLALLGLLTVIGVAGIAIRLGSARAGLFAGLTCLTFPLLVFQSRMLLSEIGTAAGATMIVYGFAFAIRPARGRWLVVDAITAGFALAVGAYLGFYSGGALLGVLVPLAACALAASLGGPMFAHVGRIGLHVAGRGARPARWTRGDWIAGAVAIVATLAAITVAVVLAVQTYDLRDPIPGTRALLGKSIVPSDCWSTALGGLWRFDDIQSVTYDVAFEHVAFGTFPLGIAAPIAIGFLLTRGERESRYAGAVTLVWAAGAWVATVAFQRKVGFNIYAGFPAMAVAIGLWLDRVAGDSDDTGGIDDDRDGGRYAGYRRLAGLFVIAGAITLGRDMMVYPDRFTSLLVGGEAIKYPKNAELLGLSLKTWPLVIGIFTCGALAVALWLPIRYLSRLALAIAVIAMLGVALFWSHGWHRKMSFYQSSKSVFATYRDLRDDGDVLAIQGDLGNAPKYYAGGPYEKLAGRDKLFEALKRPQRVFAIAPAAELCAIHRTAAAAGTPYYVLDNSNARSILLTNQLDGATDHNILKEVMLRSEPPNIKARPPGRIVWDDRIELIGWDMPDKTDGDDDFQMKLYFKVLKAVGGQWKIFVHFDGCSNPRFVGDHAPIGDRCQTNHWDKDDYLVDRFTVRPEHSPRGACTVFIGFWAGGGEGKRMPVSAAPPGSTDNDNRVKLGTVVLQ
jgi:hypothetical protein